MNWKIGKHKSEVVSDTKVKNTNFPTGNNPKESRDEELEYYGGYLVAESIGNEEYANLISAAPDLLNNLKMILDKYQKSANFRSTDLDKIRRSIAKAEGRI